MKIRLCYRLEKEAGFSEDEFGNPEAVYVCCKIDVKRDPIPRKTYKELVKGFRNFIANQQGIDKNYITPITLNEYLNKTEEEED